MCETVELISDRLIDLAPPMAVEVGPDGRVTVEIFAAFRVAQDGAFALDKNEGFMAGRVPVPHLGEGMPEMGADQVLRIASKKADFVQTAEFAEKDILHPVKWANRNSLRLATSPNRSNMVQGPRGQIKKPKSTSIK